MTKTGEFGLRTFMPTGSLMGLADDSRVCPPPPFSFASTQLSELRHPWRNRQAPSCLFEGKGGDFASMPSLL